MSIKRRFGSTVSCATVFALALAAGIAHAQSAVHGTGTAATIPVWTNGMTIGNGLLTQSGGNVTNATGNLAGKQLISTVGMGTPPLIVTSTTQVPDLKASFLGMFGPDGFIHNSSSLQSPATFNISGDGTLGGALSAASFSVSGDGTLGGKLSAASFSVSGDGTLGGTLSAGNVNVLSTGAYSIGSETVLSVSDPLHDTAIGHGAFESNVSGLNNTAAGFQALASNTDGSDNTAVGHQALQFNTATSGTGNGENNTAIGSEALQDNTVGNNNTAIGRGALRLNTDGSHNVAVGLDALANNTSAPGTGLGADNTAMGNSALFSNTTGNNNTAIGHGALTLNTTGDHNTALGDSAGENLTMGAANIFVGVGAGSLLTSSESNNIDIGNGGVALDSGVIRIGDAATQKKAFVAGITGVTTGGAAVAVLVDGNGQLGTASSSRRYKEDIQDMGTASDGLLRLRPVTFRYKKAYDDGSKPIQYGLVAEEVAEVYPDLVVRGKDGQVETVQYYKLDAMLLNEIQKLAKAHAADQAEIAELKSQLADQLKQGQEQQAAMRQLLDQVRVIQATLAAGSTPKAATTEVAAKY